MDGSRGSALLRWWADRAQHRAAREPGRAPGTPSATGASPGPEQPLGRRLVGEATPVVRLAVVQAGTVALLLDPAGGVHVRWPAELLVPPLLVQPGKVVARALPVSTEPVHVDVALPGLVSFDGYPVDPVTLRLELQLDAADGFAGLAALVGSLGTGVDPVSVEAALLDPVRRACVAAAQAAVAMNRLAELQRLGLGHVLADRWLPTEFSDGLLRRRGFDVVETDAAGRPEDEPTVPVLGRHPVVTPGVRLGGG